MRLNLAFLEEAHTVLHRLPDAGRVVHSIVAPEEPQSGDVLDKENVGWYLRDSTTGKANDDKTTFPGDATINVEVQSKAVWFILRPVMFTATNS